LDRTAGHIDTETFALNTKKCLKEGAAGSNQQTAAEVLTFSCRSKKNSSDDVNADNLNTMMVERPDEMMSSSQPHSKCVSKKFREESNPLSSSVRLWESRCLCSMSTLCTQSLREQEGAGNRTVIIIENIKEVEKCENCECCCFEEDGRQKPRVAQNVNFSCIRHRVVTTEGEARGSECEPFNWVHRGKLFWRRGTPAAKGSECEFSGEV